MMSAKITQPPASLVTATCFRCINGCATYPLSEPTYACRVCHGLLEVVHPSGLLASRSAEAWRRLFDGRPGGVPGPYGSGVWRFHEWVLPELPVADIVSLGEGATPLTRASRLGDRLDLQLFVKQCGQSLSGSFKDLGMTVLMSQVHHLRQQGVAIPAVVCASTGDTSAALAAYGAAAGVRTLVLLPQGKISAAQLIQPLAHGARVIIIDTDFDGCMAYVQRLAEEEGVYLANSKNSLRIEGQKTVSFEIAQGMGWQVPDWVAIPGGNLGNVSALARGFTTLRDAGLIDRLPRLLCAQVDQANPLFRSFKANYAPLAPVVAGHTQASAIRIGNPVSFAKAVDALRISNGVVESVSEAELSEAGRQADLSGLYVCPHTAVALAAVTKQRANGTIRQGESVVVVATAHGLKFTEFKTAVAADTVPGAKLGHAMTPHAVADDYAAVRDAALGT